MKSTRSSTIGLLAALGAFLVIGTNPTAYGKETKSSSQTNGIFATGPEDGGRLFIKRSAATGRNITIILHIDGQPAGMIPWGRTYDRYITPGKHVLTAEFKHGQVDWRGTVDVRAGQTYSYVASYTVGKIRLDASSR